MDQLIDLNLKVTLLDDETIKSRAAENGFDDVASYIKVAALNAQTFTLNNIQEPIGRPSIEYKFQVTQEQMQKIQNNMKQSSCDDLTNYLQYVAQHAVISAVVEVRSTGSLDEMLARIGKSRNLDLS